MDYAGYLNNLQYVPTSNGSGQLANYHTPGWNPTQMQLYSFLPSVPNVNNNYMQNFISSAQANYALPVNNLVNQSNNLNGMNQYHHIYPTSQPVNQAYYQTNEISNGITCAGIANTCRTPQNNSITSTFDPFRHREILERLKRSVNQYSSLTWFCRNCFYSDNPIHVNNCEKCNCKRFPSFPLIEVGERVKPRSISTQSSMESSTNSTDSLDMNLLSLKDTKSNECDEKDFWSCQKCSLNNPPSGLVCDVCQTSKPHLSNKSKRKSNRKKSKMLERSAKRIEQAKTESDDTSCSSSSLKVEPWICSACTFENCRTTVICDMCNTISNSVYGRTEEPERLSDDKIIDLEWNYVVSKCRLDKSLYVDKSFPADPRSLYYSPDAHKSDKVRWARLRNVEVDEIDRKYTWDLFRDITEPSDVCQGSLKNCWFLGALIVLLDREQLIRSLFVTNYMCPQGAYQVRLCQDGVWKTLLIDDLAPCDESGYLCFSKVSRKQLWIPLIEKAAAKLYGCYEALYLGTVIESLNLLTGAPCEDLSLHPTDKEGININFVWSKLLFARENCFLVVSTCNSTGTHNDEYDKVGLYLHHAYSILDVREIKGNRLLQLREPYGDDTWRGDWSENSPLWTPYFRGKLQPDGPKPGIFWISFEDFIKYFYNIGICRVRSNWDETIITGEFSTFEKQQLSCISFIVFETTELDFILYQENLRKFEAPKRYYRDLCLVLFKKIDSYSCHYKFVGYSSRLQQGFISFYKQLEAGEYVAVPISFSSWHSSKFTNSGYQLTIYSSKKILTEEAFSCSLTLRDVIATLAKRCGEVQRLLPGLFIYSVKKEFLGSITLVENLYEDRWVHLRCSHENSGCFNVVSSRGKALTTVDSVPPLHGQIIAVFTQLKCDLKFSAMHKLDFRLSYNSGLDDWGKDSNESHVPEINTETDNLHHPFHLLDFSYC